MTPAGEFQHLVTLEQPVGTSDPTTGEPVADFVPVCEVWSKVHPLSAREQLRTKQVQSDTTHRITIRYRQDINPTWRASWDDPRGHHIANINGIVETDRRRELEIDATETHP